MNTERDVMRALFARVCLTIVYGGTLLVSRALKRFGRAPWTATGRIAVTGTFHNPNWYLSHVGPLAGSGREVLLVTDEPLRPLVNVRFACPPRWLRRMCTRAGAKMLKLIAVGRRYRPDLFMGYHLFPGAVSALLAARLFGRPACYQMTAGPLEYLGGGWQVENVLCRCLRRPSRWVERLALALTREFDLVVVRGTQARAALVEHGLNGQVSIITGSVDPAGPSGAARDYDLVFVGRLSAIKQPGQFVEVVAAVAREVADVRAVVIGAGPLRDELEAQAERLGVTDRIAFLGRRTDVDALLARSRVFVLTSKWEGLSIAMIEAMAAGAVPVVADVGELGDLVRSDCNGYLVAPGAVEAYARHAVRLLGDRDRWARMSAEATATALRHCGRAAIARRWRDELDELVARTGGGQGREREAG